MIDENENQGIAIGRTVGATPATGRKQWIIKHEPPAFSDKGEPMRESFAEALAFLLREYEDEDIAILIRDLQLAITDIETAAGFADRDKGLTS